MSSSGAEIGAGVSRPAAIVALLGGRSHLLEALFLVVALGMLAFGYRVPSMRTSHHHEEWLLCPSWFATVLRRDRRPRSTNLAVARATTRPCCLSSAERQ